MYYTEEMLPPGEALRPRSAIKIEDGKAMGRRVLVIEDEAHFHELIEHALAAHGYSVVKAFDGDSGLEMGLRDDYDLVILDVVLPGRDGFAVCSALRQAKQALPILMLTSQSEVSDKVEGLSSGADDYVTKPFDEEELVARIEALLRRAALTRRPTNELLVFGPLKIDLLARRVTLEGKAIDLTLKEFDLLVFFAMKPGIVFSRKQLMKDLWGISAADFEPTVTVHLSRLRSKIESDAGPAFIQTVHGQGYRFAAPDEVG